MHIRLQNFGIFESIILLIDEMSFFMNSQIHMSCKTCSKQNSNIERRGKTLILSLYHSFLKRNEKTLSI